MASVRHIWTNVTLPVVEMPHFWACEFVFCVC